MTSEKQKKANIANAKLSTGPVTSAGKSIVGLNAIKHGIFAKDLVIATGDGREDEKEYRQLLSDLKNQLAPVGRMESLIVEKIAVNYWRLRRLIRYETGEIRQELDNFRESALSRQQSGSFGNHNRQQLEYYTYSDEISDAEYQAQSIKMKSLQSSDFSLTDEKWALDYILQRRMKKTGPEFTNEEYKEAKKYVSGLSPQLQGKLRREMREEAEQILAEMKEVRSWNIKFDQIQKSKSLPKEKDLNKIIKYENSLERSIFRNLAVLRTLQENRK